jgi:dipeptidyl aminopeptidase/acylaminoacyl peptidase
MIIFVYYNMNKLKSILSGLLFIFIISAGCKKVPDQQEAAPSSQDLLNVSYGTHVRNSLDVYLPEQRDAKTSVILLVHGGSWLGGDKSAFTDLAKSWRDKGYAAVTMNYRLTNTPENNIHPAQVNDIAKAIGYISSKAAEWKISSDKFGLMGVSAGGHLALLYTYKYDSSNKVKTVISMAGPTDFTPTSNLSATQIQIVQFLIGTPYLSNPSAYAEASPISHVKANSKPTLLFHGKLDVVVPFQQSVDLKNRLVQFSTVHKLVTYEDTGHEVINANYMASFLAECENWFKLHLK